MLLIQTDMLERFDKERHWVSADIPEINCGTEELRNAVNSQSVSIWMRYGKQ